MMKIAKESIGLSFLAIQTEGEEEAWRKTERNASGGKPSYTATFTRGSIGSTKFIQRLWIP